MSNASGFLPLWIRSKSLEKDFIPSPVSRKASLLRLFAAFGSRGRLFKAAFSVSRFAQSRSIEASVPLPVRFKPLPVHSNPLRFRSNPLGVHFEPLKSGFFPLRFRGKPL